MAAPEAPEREFTRAFTIVNRDGAAPRLVDTLHAPDPMSAVSMARALYGGDLLTAQLAGTAIVRHIQETRDYPTAVRWVVFFATPFPTSDPRWEEYVVGEVRAPTLAAASQVVRARFPLATLRPLTFSRVQSLVSYRLT